MKDKNGVANIHISARGNLSKKSLSEYLNRKNHKKFNIDVQYIKSIKIIPNERKRLLQLADCCCSALFQALKYHNDIHFNYIKKIKEKIYCKQEHYLGYGLKLVPSNSKAPELHALIIYITKKSELSPA